VHDVLASLGEGVKTHKESVGRDLPLVLGLALVFKVGILELRTDVEGLGQLLMGVMRLFILDGLKDLNAVDISAALFNDGIADLSDQYYEAGWRVIVLRVVPDQQDRVHNGYELLGHLKKFLRGVVQAVKQRVERL